MQSVKIILKGNPADSAAADAATAAVAAVLPVGARNLCAPLRHNPVTGKTSHRIVVTARLDAEAEAQALYDTIMAAMPAGYAMHDVDWHEDTASAQRATWAAQTAAIAAAKLAADTGDVAKVYAAVEADKTLDKATADKFKAIIAASTGKVAAAEVG